jgi:hypothetical protein
MKNLNAEERFHIAVKLALDDIKGELIPDRGIGDIVDYCVGINSRLQGWNNQFKQNKIISYLKKEKVIEEIGEPDIIESGEKYTPSYVPFYTHHFKILERFNEFYEKFQGISNRLLNQTNIDNIKTDWKWLNRKKGEYQFGNKSFMQGGRKRRRVFKAIMELYEGNSEHVISTQILILKTKIDSKHIYIEINAISKRMEDKVGLYLLGSRKGYYTIEKVPLER